MLIEFPIAIALLAAPATQAPAQPDVDVTLERTACFGTCPVYSVHIRGDGEVEYAGKEFVRVVGPARKRISAAAVQQLIDAIQQAGYFEMAPEYRFVIGPDGSRAFVTDMPTTTTSVRVGARRHSIVDYVGAPEALHEIERAIDRAAGTAEWIRD